MALKSRPVPPTAGKSSTEKKVAASRAAEFEVGAIDTKKAIAEPKVLKPVPKKLTKVAEAEAPAKAEEPKKTTKKAATKKAEPKAAAKKTATKKAEPKAAAKKTATKKAEPKTAVKKTEKFEIQFSGKNITTEDITARLAEIYAEQGKKKTYIKKASFYVKPEESKVYYVVNDTETGDFWI